MIEITIQNFLAGALEAPVYTEIPENPPERFIVVEKTGSNRINHIFSATLAIQSYGGSLYDAAVLNEAVKGAMLYREPPEIVTGVRIEGDYPYTDPETKRYRYQAVFTVYHYWEGYI